MRYGNDSNCLKNNDTLMSISWRRRNPVSLLRDVEAPCTLVHWNRDRLFSQPQSHLGHKPRSPDMASSPTSLLQLLHRAPAPVAIRCLAGPASPPPPLLAGRRQCLVLLLSSPAPLLAGASSARAEDVPLFGLRKKLKKIEEEAEEIVKKGEKAVEEGFVAAEKEIQVAEEGIAAEAGVGVAGDLLQAGAVAGAEAIGVLVGVSVVNGILGPERQKT